MVLLKYVFKGIEKLERGFNMKIAIIGAMEEEVTLLRDKIEDKQRGNCCRMRVYSRENE